MADNIAPELVEQELEARFCIPNEVWTDIFKLFPRRSLVRSISPICYRFKEICNKNVKNVHEIFQMEEFENKLVTHEPEAYEQLRLLKANNCPLSGQFRLNDFFLSLTTVDILNHCLDLFRGCRIKLNIRYSNQICIEYYLDLLEPTIPTQISISQGVGTKFEDYYWQHPTVQKCNRLEFCSFSEPINFMAIFEWLHHRPMQVDNGADVATQEVRSLICHIKENQGIDWLLNSCIQNLQMSQSPMDRRQFVLSFFYEPANGPNEFGPIENQSTGEVLLLERVMEVCHHHMPCPKYRLRRCLAQEIADGMEFYANLFKRVTWMCDDAFNDDEEETEVTTI